ncbi:Nn.00g056360.m01.CDS01 [Neocucurbitaria sp. VM-36]
MVSEGFETSFQRQLASQSWTLYGIGMFVICTRTFARWRRVRSISQFAADDWIMVTAVPLFYTGLVVCLNIIATGGGSNLFPPEQFSTFTQAEIDERIKGSKIVVVSEQCMLNVIWLLKACMLFMFARMISGTSYIKWIRIVAAYVIVGWVAVQIAFFTACRPFVGYWGMPPPNPQCTTLEHFAIVQATFNLSSDLLIIAIPIPMVASLSLPLKQKLGLGVLFSMGTFVIIAAILTKVYNLSDVYDTAYMLWYTREASVAVYVANLPGIWPLLREHIRFLRDHTNSYVTGASKMPKYGGYGSQYGNMSKGPRSRVRTFTNLDSDEIELGASYAKSSAQSIRSGEKTKIDERANPFTNSTNSGRPSQDSDDRAMNEAMNSWKQPNTMEVQVDTKVEIQRDDWDVSKLESGQSRVHVKIEGPEGEVIGKKC